MTGNNFIRSDFRHHVLMALAEFCVQFFFKIKLVTQSNFSTIPSAGPSSLIKFHFKDNKLLVQVLQVSQTQMSTKFINPSSLNYHPNRFRTANNSTKNMSKAEAGLALNTQVINSLVELVSGKILLHL